MALPNGSEPPELATAPLSTGTAKELTTSASLHAHLAALTARESQLTAALNDLVSNRDTLDDAIDRLQSLVPRIKDLSVEVDGRPALPGSANPFASWPHENVPDRLALDGAMGEEGLVDRVSRVWETSERVGGKVRKLDTEVSRVKQAADRVTAVLDLKVGFHRPFACGIPAHKRPAELAATAERCYTEARLGVGNALLQAGDGH